MKKWELDRNHRRAKVAKRRHVRALRRKKGKLADPLRAGGHHPQ
jgi:hypothetical protein